METFIKLGLKEIASIIQTMGVSTDINSLDGKVDFVDNSIKYEKEGNKLVATSEDDRKTTIEISTSEETTKDFLDKVITFLYHKIAINYYLHDGSRVELTNFLSINEDFGGFTNIQRHDLLNGLKVKYYDNEGKEKASFSPELDKLCLEDDNKIYEFYEDGITCGNKIISLEGDALVLLKGGEAPSLEDIESFDVDKEKRRIEVFIKNNPSLHRFTKEALDDTLRLLDRKNRYAKEVKEFYDEDIKGVRKAIALRNKVINGIENEIITDKEMEEISNSFRESISGKRKIRSTNS